MHVAVNMVGARHRRSVVLMLGPRVIGGIGLASLGGVWPPSQQTRDIVPVLF